MKISQILSGKLKSTILFIVIFGLFNSLLNGTLLFFINAAVTGRGLAFPEAYKLPLYVGVVLLALVCSRYFQVYMIRLTSNITFEFEKNILEKIRCSTLTEFDALGKENIYTAINDTKSLAHIPEIFMNAFNAMVVVLCCFGYMFWVAPLGGVIILFTMAILVTIYLIRNKGIQKDLNQQRDLQNSYYRYLNDAIQGFRELKINVQRSNNVYHRWIFPNRERNREITNKTSVKYLDNEISGTYSWYVVFGVIMFVLPLIMKTNTATQAAFLVTIMYLIGPVAILITIIPTYNSLKISYERLVIFNHRLSINEGEFTDKDIHHRAESFSEVEFVDVKYQYINSNNKAAAFTISPISLRIEKGETIFVIGGNGSGKSTFGLLLTGLVKPKSGRILLNGNNLLSENITQYRSYFSAVFTDGHLFNENYDKVDLQETNTMLYELVSLLKLNDKIELEKGADRFNHNLSKGQRKRLALIYALLESKPVIVLDEWAAEQDPGFRRYFYTELIPLLQQRGKTVIVITHDDEYYKYASRIIKFNFGEITYDSSKQETVPGMN
ncbi:cyclic peptide export ABC transporter [Chitinophaga sancti]|uniref:Cyclic peptide export ABC transporter n=1 Tax=Chitinophaga sancti TaxID=1004 RepID=A0A1K1SSD3_9BACT|nr:cyclic peptide export ABC transporter [Chitinophaga sancti]WQD64516.1 cyclic peptide export ABC transporter [Chitinophaga sancti]WQG89859.1 cyclic peptide export ABC transporter [Chitinophaga sancti]SFW87198.1 putative ATP-binding cassette transporter [Chitinophaga sancti]